MATALFVAGSTVACVSSGGESGPTMTGSGGETSGSGGRAGSGGGPGSGGATLDGAGGSGAGGTSQDAGIDTGAPSGSGGRPMTTADAGSDRGAPDAGATADARGAADSGADANQSPITIWLAGDSTVQTYVAGNTRRRQRHHAGRLGPGARAVLQHARGGQQPGHRRAQRGVLHVGRAARRRRQLSVRRRPGQPQLSARRQRQSRRYVAVGDHQGRHQARRLPAGPVRHQRRDAHLPALRELARLRDRLRHHGRRRARAAAPRRSS